MLSKMKTWDYKLRTDNLRIGNGTKTATTESLFIVPRGAAGNRTLVQRR